MNAINHPNLGNDLPVIVIGTGPVGLAAAAHLLARGIGVKLLEAGPDVGSHVRDWGHIRLFSPWSYNIDAASRALLLKTGWQAPRRSQHPTGAELHTQYLKPLAETPEIASVVEYDARVIAVSRLGFDKMKSSGRDLAPFTILVRKPDGAERIELARAVIDCSGTWSQHNPIGTNGLPVPGEIAARDRIAYGTPDVLTDTRYANQRILVTGAGHSAANVLLDLVALRQRAPQTEIIWAVRGASLARLFGGGANDKLEARGALGRSLENMVAGGQITVHMQSSIAHIETGEPLTVTLRRQHLDPMVIEVDRIIVATGQRPDLTMLREVRLDLDPATESPRILAPMIDPNVHSCGTVRPHGHRELAQPDAGFYIAGIKSYGRAPTFLLATGYEQVRSIAAAIAGDLAAADDIQLELPETGVCSTNLPVETSSCSSSSCSTQSESPAVQVVSGCGTSKAKQTTTQGCC